MERVSLTISGIDCPTCAGKIEKALKRRQGVSSVAISLATGRADITFEPSLVSVEHIKAIIQGLGHPVEGKSTSALRRYWRIAVSGLLVLLSFTGLSEGFTPIDIFALAALLIGGLPLIIQSFRDIRRLDISADVFMSLGVIASASIGEFRSAAIIAFFMLIAAFIDSFTMGRSRKAIRELVEHAPKTARVQRDGVEVEMPADEVTPGEIVVVRPGEMIPVEGVIAEGRGAVNEATITGESMPVEKAVGDRVFAATINQLGVLFIRVSEVGANTTYGRIIRLVEEAESAKAPVQRIADRFAAWFTPAILLIAAATYFFTGDLRNAIAVVVVACPCSIAVATPLAVIASMGRAARRGIIIKGGRYLEALATADTLVLDKTGTVTVGVPVVTNIFALSGNFRDVLTLAASTEKYSEHSLARAVLKAAADRQLDVPSPVSSTIMPGLGVEAELADGSRTLLGNRLLLSRHGITTPPDAEIEAAAWEEGGKTALMLAHNGRMVGMLAVADVIRDQTVTALASLRSMGFNDPVMLTGDNARTAQAIAARLGIKQVAAGLLPHDKVERIAGLVGQGKQVIMVGDGINDAPALARAHVGIAMGAAGSAAAIEAADVALMRDDWRQVAEAVAIGRRTRTVIRQNLAIGLVFNIVGISLASVGILSPMGAAVAHVLPDVLVFLNAAKLLRDP